MPSLRNLVERVRALPTIHKLAAALIALAALVSVTITVVDTPGPTPAAPHTRTVNVTITPRVAQAEQKAASTPTPGCDPATGTAKLGSCAPVQALARVDQHAQANGEITAAAASALNPRIAGHPVGVDVSSYQGCTINWKFIPVQFAFFKATEGTRYTDQCLHHNVASAKAAHKLYGVYDFLRPGRSTATAEADHFVAAVRAAGANTSLPPVADIEVNQGLSPAALNAYVCTWHKRVASQLHRTITITYTGNWFWAPQLAGNHCGTRLWVSAYTWTPIIPRPWTGWTFWQFSDGRYGPQPRIGRWDVDVYAGTQAQLEQLAGLHAPHAPAASPAVLHALTAGERANALALLAERRTARRHGGWTKLRPAHLRRAERAKHWLLARNRLLHRLGLHGTRAARHRVIHQVI